MVSFKSCIKFKIRKNKMPFFNNGTLVPFTYLQTIDSIFKQTYL